ncbi:MAG: phenylalanine--tRNA ligase subunit beta [Armatimonadota bacterium]|nr:phenylalanine--tRNA ligase subunit beta [Armatimonadota bacterium]
MRVSVNWLREYVDFDCSPDELAQKLTMVGLEVEESRLITAEEFAALGGSGEQDDIVWDTKVTPNRGDLLSVLGTAREVGAVVGRAARVPSSEVVQSGPKASQLINIRIDAPDLCRRYAGVVIRGVSVGPSPGWLRDRIIAAGMRPINNVVDVTNYVMFELGQPLHAFDYRLLRGPQIIVRRARTGEALTTIDGEKRDLDSDMLVIADAERPVALAGIMGGADTEITDRTVDILIESANFDPVGIRRTSKRLGLTTESSYRFERGVDPGVTDLAAWRAAQLIKQIAGGDVAQGIVDVYPSPVSPVVLTVRPQRVNAVLGTSIEPEVMVQILCSLGIETVFEDDILRCKVPTFRSDLCREIDLIEEIGRLYGYDKLPQTLPCRSLQGKDSREGAFTERVRRILISCACQEVLTHSLVDSRYASLVGKENEVVRVRNPLSEDLDSLRTSLAVNLLQVIARNQARGMESVSVFEIGKVFRRVSGDICETRSIAGAMVGNLWRSNWSLPSDALAADFFWCKGLVESLMDGLCIGGVAFERTRNPLLHPTRAAKVLAGGQEIGFLGEVAPEAIEFFDIKGRPCVFELDFEALMRNAPDAVSYKPLPKYPAVHRHLAVVVKESATYKEVRDVVVKSGGGILEEVCLLDVYKGPQIPPECRSLTLELVFRSSDRTLTDEEVNAVVEHIRSSLSDSLGAAFR